MCCGADFVGCAGEFPKAVAGGDGGVLWRGLASEWQVRCLVEREGESLRIVPLCLEASM